MSDPTPTPPSPQPYVHWGSLVDFVKSLGNMPLWHIAKSTASTTASAVWWAAGTLPYVASAAFLLWLAQTQGCTLPIPVPTPPAPVPVDPLTASLQAAYAKDTDADRAKSLAFLQGIYPAMAASVPASVTTNATALAWLKSKVEAPGAGLALTQVVNLRRAIADEMTAQFGTSPSAGFDPAKFRSVLGNIGNSLKAVK